MRTVTDSLNEMATYIIGSIEEMLKHSSIRRWNTGHRERGAYNVMTGGLDYKWFPMEPEGRQLQSKALEEYRRFLAIVSALLKEQPDQSLKTFDQSRQRITAIIEQNTHTRHFVHQVKQPLLPALSYRVRSVYCLVFTMPPVGRLYMCLIQAHSFLTLN